MKLKTKLLLSQCFVFAIILSLLGLALPNVVYITGKQTDQENLENMNEQIMTQINQNFENLIRFTNVVAEDDGLFSLMQEYDEAPTEANDAKTRLYCSDLGLRDNVRSYQVLGIAVVYHSASTDHVFTTVGMSDVLKQYIVEQIQTVAAKSGNAGFINPFDYMDESTTIFGNKFNLAYGYVRTYEAHSATVSVAVITSFEPIIYIAQNMGDISKDYLLVDDSGKTVQPSVSDSAIDTQATLQKMKIGKSYYEGLYTEDGAITAVQSSRYGNWKIYCRLTREDILSHNRLLLQIDLWVLTMFGLCTILMMIPLVRRFVKPLEEVSGQMNEVAKGNLEARVPIRTKDEIADVGKAFNIMAERLQKNVNAMLEHEKHEQKMRYSILVSQVDPHFIYNTMNTITYLAQRGRNEDVVAVNKAMIEILKDRLRINLEDIYDTVDQEIKVVQEYLTIQSYRYEGTFKVQYAIDENAKGCYIVKNILQPIVENALLHGILCNTDEEGEIIGGCIRIRIQVNADAVCIEIADNGIGFSEDVLGNIGKEQSGEARGKHIGIRNILERIRYIYGSDCAFRISSKAGEGTSVRMQLPKIDSIPQTTSQLKGFMTDTGGSL